MNFTKVQGLGNDFVLVNCLEEKTLPDFGELAVRVCDRNFGVGADGLVLILAPDSPENHVKMRIFNSDGSEPEMCGNAIRCFAKYVFEKGIIKEKIIRVETLGGLRIPELIMEGDQIKAVKVDMGEPILKPADIPMVAEGDKVVANPVTVGDKEFKVTAVSMGNPHAVVFVDKIVDEELKTFGPQLEKHSLFPKKTNVEFVEVLSDSEVNMRVWERGAGETLACGTGACATVVASVLNGLTSRQVTVHLAGGDLVIEWSEDNNHVYMTGPAVTVFEGRFYI